MYKADELCREVGTGVDDGANLLLSEAGNPSVLVQYYPNMPSIRSGSKVLLPEREYYESFVKFMKDFEAFVGTSHADLYSRNIEPKQFLCQLLMEDYPALDATIK